MNTRHRNFAVAFALFAIVLGAGYTPLTARNGQILTLTSASASISWTGEGPASRRAHRKAIEARKRKIETVGSTTYMDELLAGNDSSLARWPERKDRSIRVWVGGGDDLDGVTDEVRGQVQQAFFEWERSGLPVRFGFVRDSADADVHVGWVEQFDEPISGSTSWARDQNWWIASGRITLALRNASGRTLSPAAVRAITLHEVGHLLGLTHTTDSTSIMAPRVRVKSLSDVDRATMRLLYSLPAGALR